MPLAVQSPEPVPLSLLLDMVLHRLRKKSPSPFGKCCTARSPYGVSAWQRSLTGLPTYIQHLTDNRTYSISLWREKRDAEIVRRAQISAEKKEATLKKAQQDIDDFYVAYNNKLDKTKAEVQAEAEAFLANRENTSAGGTAWGRIAKLVDVSGVGSAGGASGSGKERFRKLLIDLQKDEQAPGSSGV